MEQFKTLFEEIGDTAAYEILLDNDILDEEVIPDLQPEQLQQLGVGSLGKCMKYLRRLKELVKSVQKNNLPSAAPSVALTLPTPNETASTLGAAVASPPASMPATPRPVVTTPRPVVTTPRPAVSTPSSAVSAISGSPAAEPIASASATAEATVSTPSSSPLFMRAIGEANWSHSHSRPNYDSVVLKVLRQFPDKSDIFKDASYTEDKDCYKVFKRQLSCSVRNKRSYYAKKQKLDQEPAASVTGDIVVRAEALVVSPSKEKRNLRVQNLDTIPQSAVKEMLRPSLSIRKEAFKNMKDGWSGMVVEWPIYGQEAFLIPELELLLNRDLDLDALGKRAEDLFMAACPKETNPNDSGFEKLVIVIGKRLGDKKMLAETPEHKVSHSLPHLKFGKLCVDGEKLSVSEDPLVLLKLLAVFYIGDIEFGDAKKFGQLLEFTFLGSSTVRKGSKYLSVDKFMEKMKRESRADDE
ncbi:uncharacterized protein [Watersipora subatra]|uniref:uncharacterized protein isoform X2 n=2 Tax=Watersipora subatra TaxID=2589382 RepID=UPI00355C34AD